MKDIPSYFPYRGRKRTIYQSKRIIRVLAVVYSAKGESGKTIEVEYRHDNITLMLYYKNVALHIRYRNDI